MLTWKNGSGFSKQLGTVQRCSENDLEIVVGKPLPPLTGLTIFFGGSHLIGTVRKTERQGSNHSLAIELEHRSENAEIPA